MEFKYHYTCTNCGRTRTRVYDLGEDNRPPAPYDVPRKIECGGDDCEGTTMERTNK